MHIRYMDFVNGVETKLKTIKGLKNKEEHNLIIELNGLLQQYREVTIAITELNQLEPFIKFLSHQWKNKILNGSSYTFKSEGELICHSLAKQLVITCNLMHFSEKQIRDFLTPPLIIKMDDFVRKACDLINGVSLTPASDCLPFIYVESHIAIEKLKVELLKHQQNKKVVTKSALQHFLNLVTERVTTIQGSDYANPDTNANRVYLEFAELLRKAINFNLVEKKAIPVEEIFPLAKKNSNGIVDEKINRCIKKNVIQQLKQEENEISQPYTTHIKMVGLNVAIFTPFFFVNGYLNYDDMLDHFMSLNKQEQWKTFVAKISHEDFVKLLTNGNGTKTEHVLEIPGLFNKDERRSKAILFCLFEIYLKDRKAVAAPYTTYAGQMASYFWTVPDEHQKCSAVLKMQERFMSDLSLVDIWHEYHNRSSELAVHLFALNEGRLLRFMNEIWRAVEALSSVNQDVYQARSQLTLSNH